MSALAHQPYTLRPYQIEALHAVESAKKRGVQRGLIVLFTSAGKTTIAAELCRSELAIGGKVLFMAHTDELLDQASKRFQSLVPEATVGIEGGVFRAHRTSNVVVASVPTIGLDRSSRLDWFRPTLVICDEAHRSVARTYMNAARRFGCFNGSAFYLGMTATPHRMDNKPLHGSEEAVYEEVCYNYPVRDAIIDGWVCDIRAYRAIAGYSLNGIKTTGGDFNQAELERRANTDELNIEAFQHWRSVADDRPTICFATGVAHAFAMRDVFQSAGYSAETVVGTTPIDQRKQIIADCKAGSVQVLVNVGIAIEGFDWPQASCILMLRPTKSWTLFVQCIGRGLRLAPNKENCIVLDIVGEESGSTSSANLHEVLGLPRGLNQGGYSVKATTQWYDDLPYWVKARLAGREFDLDGIDNVLREIDLLAELDPPSEVQAASTFAWERISDRQYIIECGQDRIKGFSRSACILCDALGNWSVGLFEQDPGKAKGLIEKAAVGSSLREALRSADALMESRWPSVGAIVDRNAPWRSRTAKSEKQMQWLRTFGLTDAEINSMNAGQVSAFLDRKFREKRNKY